MGAALFEEEESAPVWSILRFIDGLESMDEGLSDTWTDRSAAFEEQTHGGALRTKLGEVTLLSLCLLRVVEE